MPRPYASDEEDDAHASVRGRPAYQYNHGRLWGAHVESLIELLKRSVPTATGDPELLVEVMGTLGNLTPSDIGERADWYQLLDDVKHDSGGERVDIMARLRDIFMPGMSEDDGGLAALPAIVFAGRAPPRMTRLSAAPRLLLLTAPHPST